MSRKIALKKLKTSDLSFFKSYLNKHPDSKQKAFNLDTNVMEGGFFPSLKVSLEILDKKATHVDLAIFGPGLASAQILSRKIKRDAKNIRLNGEIVDAPIGQTDRYDVLAPGDFAIMEFVGAAMPEGVKVVLIAKAHAEDSLIHAQCLSILPNPTDSMKVLFDEQIAELVETANPSTDHPIREWLDTELLEDLGNGDPKAAEVLNKRRPGRGISPSDFKAAKDAAERIGELGEELLDQFFQTEGWPGLSVHKWTAQVNAISPYDFLLNFGAASERHADAKSTSGDFSNRVHLSIAEIHHAVNSGIPYDIFRLYNVKETSALLRVARDIKLQLVPVLAALTAVPKGANVDSLSFDPSFFEFDIDAHTIKIVSDDDDAEATD